MKKELPLVSVIVPVYNVFECVLRCLESLAGQSYENLEILVVDDGSMDGSGEICDEFAKKDPRVRVVHQKNGGLSKARNVGISKARGEWLCFVDSDDFVKKDFVKKLFGAAFRGGAEIAVCGYEEKEKGKELVLVSPEEKILAGREATTRLLISQENVDVVAWNKIYKKSLFLEGGVRFPEGMKYEDNLTTYKLLSLAGRVTYIPEALYVYVKREGSITQSDKKVEKLKTRKLAARSAMEFFGGDTELLAAAKVSLLLAKYAFLDFAISGVIEKKYGEDALRWIRKNAGEYKRNPFLTKKLKVYNFLSTKLDGGLYRAFRKIKHE